MTKVSQYRPTLTPPPAQLPAGRKRLSPRWYHEADIPSGTTLLARDIRRQERAKRPLRRNPDLVAQMEHRGYMKWHWHFLPDDLPWSGPH